MDNPEQLDFVESEIPSGLSVIEASAGTGKTYAISHLVPRLLLDKVVENLGEILLVTFTNDAARELAERVRRVLEAMADAPSINEATKNPGIHRLRDKFSSPEHRGIIERALIDIDRLNVSTIHSFCQRTIQAEGALCGLPIMPEVITNADQYIEEALYELWEGTIASDPLLASIANSEGWTLEQDFVFVRRACAMEDFDPVPEVQDFRQTLERIRNAPGALTAEMRQELAGFIGQVPKWNTKGGDAATREVLLQTLAKAKTYSDPGFSDAVKWVAVLASHVAGTGKIGKQSKDQATHLPIVRAAQDIVELATRLRWNWQNDCVEFIRRSVSAALRAGGELTQDGLILTLRDALRSDGKETLVQRLREHYKVGLIDESQDTDPRQFEIFRSIFIGFDGEKSLPDHRLVMIGDPKQAIYGFRGADVNTYLQAKKSARRVFTLATTYRAPQPLVEAINVFFVRKGALLKQGLEFYPATSGKANDVRLFVDGQAQEGRVEAWIAPDTSADYLRSAERKHNVAGTVASEIVRLLKSGTIGDGTSGDTRLNPGHIAILTFSNSEAEIMAMALRDRGIPAVVASGADVMSTEEAHELLRILRGVNEPRRSGLRYAALATRLMGFDLSAIQGIRSDAMQDDDMLGKFVRWRQCWENKGIAAAIARIDEEVGITARLAAIESGERGVTNFRQLVDILQAASQDHSGRPEHLLRWLTQEIARAEDRSAADERQIQLESDRAAVQIVTMHKAKGLEYSLVFAPFLWSSHPGDNIRTLACSTEGAIDQLVNTNFADDVTKNTLLQSAFEDRLRLAYVAMTRAKVRLWIFGGEMGNSRAVVGAHPLDWLLRGASVEVQTSEQFAAWATIAEASGRGSRHTAGVRALFPEESASLVVVKEPPEISPERWVAESTSKQSALFALPLPHIAPAWSVTSFSSLTREANPHGNKDAAPQPVPESPVGAAQPPASGSINLFNTSPGGMLVGTAVHEWLQEWDWDEPDSQKIRAHFRQYRIQPPANRSGPAVDDSVTEMLNALRLATLPGLDCTIAEACHSRATAEWHFHLPIRESLDAASLAEAFARHAAPEHADYAPMLAALNTQELRGFLQGFIDQLAFSDTLWGVIDWKTNKLGEDAIAYSQAGMLRCAMDSHYLLQVHLYIVALRRYLRAAAPDAKIAGGWLVFLRAVKAGTPSGILHIRPPDSLLDALDRLFFEGQPAYA